MLAKWYWSEIAVMVDEFPSNEAEVLSTEGRDDIMTCSEIDESLKVEPVHLDLMLSGKSSDSIGAETGKVGTEDILVGGNEVQKGNETLCSSVHNQIELVSASIPVAEMSSTVGFSVGQIVNDDDSLNESSSHVEKELVDLKMGHKAVEMNGNVVISHSHQDAVDSANHQTGTKLTDNVISEGHVTTAGASVSDREVDAGCHDHQGSVQVAPGKSVSHSAHEPLAHVSSPAFVFPETHESNDVNIKVGPDTLFAAEVQEQPDDHVSLCEGDLAEPELEQSKDAGEHIQSDVGNETGSKEQDGGQASSFVSHSVAASHSYNNNDHVNAGSNSKSFGEIHEQDNIPESSNIVDFVASEPEDSNEAAEPIRSYVPGGIGVQDHAYDAEMVDSDLQDGDGPASNDDESNDSDHDEQMSDVGVKAGLHDTVAVSIYDEEDMDDELVADGLDSQGQDELIDDVGTSQDEEKNAKCVASRSIASLEYCASYDLPPESDDFSVSDLVWGKVKSHPWWPGQIFHPSDSSEKAVKYYRKDCYLVAYFGDRSFAWNDASLLRPFRAHFSQGENQSNSESFQNAVNDALEEVSRRVEVGLACSCLPDDIYENIRFQTVHNAGIKQEASKREGRDRYVSVDFFQPDKLVQFVRRLARFPTRGANGLEIAIAKAHLTSFYRLKGHYSLPEFQDHEGLLEDNVEPEHPPQCRTEQGDSVVTDYISGAGKSKGSLKRKHNLKDIVYQRRKEKSFSELVGESVFYYDEDNESDEKPNDVLGSPTSGRKRRANFLTDDFTVQDSTQTISLAKVSQSGNPSPRQSFKIGDCIRRVASQLTGAPSMTESPSSPKPSSEENNKLHTEDAPCNSLENPEETKSDEAVFTEETSPDQFLLQLQKTAQGPAEAYDFSKPMISFFSKFRDSVASARHRGKDNPSSRKGVAGRKKRYSLASGGLPGTFEFDERSDSYWPDMVVQHDSEDKPQRRGRKRKEHNQDAADEQEKPVKNKRKYTRKQNDSPMEKISEDEIKKEQLDTELILTFSDVACVPSEMNLNKMFRRFGPLKESETRVDRQNSHARVIFKRGPDAEVAHSSAVTFSIFGPSTVVKYQINYSPSATVESSPMALTKCSESAA